MVLKEPNHPKGFYARNFAYPAELDQPYHVFYGPEPARGIFNPEESWKHILKPVNSENSVHVGTFLLEHEENGVFRFVAHEPLAEVKTLDLPEKERQKLSLQSQIALVKTLLQEHPEISKLEHRGDLSEKERRELSALGIDSRDAYPVDYYLRILQKNLNGLKAEEK